jgi:signal transduction histidine kinase
MSGPLAALALFLALAASSPAPARQNVLIVFDENDDLPGLAVINRSLRKVFNAELKDQIEVYSESLQLSQFKTPEYYEATRDYFRRKYARQRPDLIVAVMEPSLDFLLRGRGAFEGVPIVFCGVDAADLNRQTLRPDITGVLVERDFAPTLEIALALQRDTRNVFMVGGTSRFDRKIQAIARKDLEPWEERVHISWLTELPMADLVEKLSDLPKHSIIYYLTLFTDGAGVPFVPHEVLSRITAAANAPVYASVDQYVGLGAVGGSVYSVSTHGERAADMGVRILRGAKPVTIPIVALAAQTNLFDGRELHRWELDERRLPALSTINFRSPSVWELYKWYIAGGAMLVVLQSLLVIVLIASRAQRRRADEEARLRRDELAHALRVATLGELTASFAHELSQPLTAVTANAQAARKMLAIDRADPEIQEVLEDVAADALRATETFRRLHALFRKEDTERTALDVNAVIEELLKLFAANLRSRYIDMVFEPAAALPAVLADAVQLRQVLINVLVNAEDAITLAGSGPREVRIQTRLAGSAVAISIADTGAGVEAGNLDRIFDHFFTSKPQGLGLGLAISRSIVQAHGGRMWASRNPGRGITVHMEFPARADLHV